jgi:hypothetical protein
MATQMQQELMRLQKIQRLPQQIQTELQVHPMKGENSRVGAQKIQEGPDAWSSGKRSRSCIAQTGDLAGRSATLGFVFASGRTDLSETSPGSVLWTESSPRVAPAEDSESASYTFDISCSSS